MKVAILYWSKSGNTEKVAAAIKECMQSIGAEIDYLRVNEAKELDFFDYDLICLGFPSYRWHPPQPVENFLVEHFNKHQKQGRIKVGAPQLPGKSVIIFCTYSGPHTGINEAIPAGKYAAQFFEHIGFKVLDELYVVGEFHGAEELNTQGKLGDIRGRPNEKDLEEVKTRVKNLLKHRA
ncbi:MAG: flavodoxin domain-containing protein [candidate division WOR-3 bacterium]|nr:MAG: flavodoxin domain-containing protein [candidate division WOR-3 bacterium]